MHVYTHIHIYRDRERATVGVFLIIKQVWKTMASPTILVKGFLFQFH